MNYDCRDRFYRGGTAGGLIRRGFALLLGLSLAQGAFATSLTDDELRQKARDAGLDALELSHVPDMSHLDKYIAREDYVLALGKALFWDMQVGGGEVQACASCHFAAGADPRHINQISPGLNAGDEEFEPKASGAGGPNFELAREDFPFYEVSPGTNCNPEIPVDSGHEDLADCKGGKFDNDVVSSQGVFLRSFNGFTPPGEFPDCTSVEDSVFNKEGGDFTHYNSRRVEPRNTPTVINAVFNHRNFWDGRANNLFNGVNPLGLRGQLKATATAAALNACLAGGGDPLDSSDDLCGLRDTDKAVWKYDSSSRDLHPRWPLEDHSSLASQAVGPPGSIFEMSCGDNRTFSEIGRVLLVRRALRNQEVHSGDPVLASFRHSSGIGLRQNYSSLVRRAFKRDWWGKTRGNVPGTDFKQMEANFPLFFGIAIQMYEATLVANETPFDKFMRGEANHGMGEYEKEGLEVFINGDSKCVTCHGGPEFTGASVDERHINNPFSNDYEDISNPSGQPTERMFMGDGKIAVYDGGFYNIGVRATDEDLCVGGEQAGFPLSFSRQASSGELIDAESRVFATGSDTELWQAVELGDRVAVDGACKTPSVRMAAYTAPYFHSGQSATLLGVVDHYGEQFRELFSVENFDDLDSDILDACVEGDDVPEEEWSGMDQFPCEVDEDAEHGIASGQTRVHEGVQIDERDVAVLVKFMANALTDDRVVYEEGVFSRPALCVPNDHPEPIYGNAIPHEIEALDNMVCRGATGSAGGPAVQKFLDIDQADIHVPPPSPSP